MYSLVVSRPFGVFFVFGGLGMREKIYISRQQISEFRSLERKSWLLSIILAPSLGMDNLSSDAET